jgi:hypothetical protein
MKSFLLSIMTGVLIAASPASAQHNIEKGIIFLNTSELKTIYGKGTFVLVNTLSPIEFREKRIAGSINVPLSHYADGKVSLPADREARLIFYCMGAK